MGKRKCLVTVRGIDADCLPTTKFDI